MEKKRKDSSSFDFVNIIVALWIIIFTVLPLVFGIKDWIESNKKPTLDEYRKENYYITNGEEYVSEYIGLESTDTYTYQDVVDAYNAGLEDGIEQTTDYYNYTME